jgi:hypothetical protein
MNIRITLFTLLVSINLSFVDIEKINLIKHVDSLCSFEYYGRNIFDSTEAKSANYIKTELIKHKLKSFNNNFTSYYQNFHINNFNPKRKDSYIRQKNDTLYLEKDVGMGIMSFNYIGKEKKFKLLYLGELTSEIKKTYKDSILSDKFVLIDNTNKDCDSFKDYLKNKNCKNYAVIVPDSYNITSQFKNNYYSEIKKIEHSNLLIKKNLIGSKCYLEDKKGKNHFVINLKNALLLLGLTKEDYIKIKEKENSWFYESKISDYNKHNKHIWVKVGFKKQKLVSQNVISYIPGKSNRNLIISAHYDHKLSMPGADDNASGVSALLEISRVLKENYKNIKPNHNIVFCFWGSEEFGQLGSRYYTDFNPIYPLDSTILNINLDMIGRYRLNESDDNSIFILGSRLFSSELNNIVNKLNNRYVKLNLDTTYLTPYLNYNKNYFRAHMDPNFASDQYNFIRHGIPTVSFFSGNHIDTHTNFDTPDKLNFSRIKKVAILVCKLVEYFNEKTDLKLNKNYNEIYRKIRNNDLHSK